MCAKSHFVDSWRRRLRQLQLQRRRLRQLQLRRLRQLQLRRLRRRGVNQKFGNYLPLQIFIIVITTNSILMSISTLHKVVLELKLKTFEQSQHWQMLCSWDKLRCLHLNGSDTWSTVSISSPQSYALASFSGWWMTSGTNNNKQFCLKWISCC